MSSAAVDLMVDWDLAARTAARFAGPGPQVSPSEAEQAVAELRTAARASTRHVLEVSKLAEPGTPGEVTAPDDVLVLDRRGWATANAAGFRSLLEPVVEEAFQRRGERRPSAAVAGVGSRVTAAEVGSLLGFLASRVLGQYDPFADPGRLMLVAPNIVQAERELAVDARDFRLWVCLHEETHRLQFTANPWLAEHLRSEIRDMVGHLLLDPGQVMERLVSALRSLPGVVRGQGEGTSLLDLAATGEQREKLAALTAVMSLLEGHADVVMDEVGPQVVPTVATIRSRFTARRAGRGAVDRLLRRLLGLDAKMRQYADGARFVREVHSAVGTDGFNQVWSGPLTLPSAAEIADPATWVSRVHG